MDLHTAVVSRSTKALRLVAALALLHSTAVRAACFEEAGLLHRVDPQLLCAIAMVESSGNPEAMNLGHLERTGSFDIGLMQINSGHLGTLARWKIGKRELTDGCISAKVAAWILADLYKRFGESWEAVGAYNAACTQLKGAACRKARDAYISKVQKALPRCEKQTVAGASPHRGSLKTERELVSVDFDPADRRYSSFNTTHDTPND
jgi:soluble lytic murein transglycosylase-like protein